MTLEPLAIFAIQSRCCYHSWQVQLEALGCPKCADVCCIGFGWSTLTFANPEVTVAALIVAMVLAVPAVEPMCHMRKHFSATAGEASL